MRDLSNILSIQIELGIHGIPCTYRLLIEYISLLKGNNLLLHPEVDKEILAFYNNNMNQPIACRVEHALEIELSEVVDPTYIQTLISSYLGSQFNLLFLFSSQLLIVLAWNNCECLLLILALSQLFFDQTFSFIFFHFFPIFLISILVLLFHLM